ncbi:hypothetical protein GCM10023322_07820 [Rugosimonospora acidiphila]|uniref:SRPBCC domain-containing protein n=1 Tax=Rugosimonospora acidiphila TaxID=556531 RepID=A0ABP9RL70_9ACTN
MSESGPATGLFASTDAGTVRVGIRSPRPPSEVWPALYEVDRVAQWFGTLDRPWRAGQASRVDFGDGDFFDIGTVAVVPGESITFDWSFLSIGTTARVRWQVIPATASAAGNDRIAGTEVLVEDRQPGRTPAEADELLSGWTDFFERLSRHLATGQRTRYDTRDDIDGSVTLTGHAPRLAEPDTIHRWLPIATDGFVPRWFFIVDEDGPRRFRVDAWQAEPDGVSFVVEVPEALRATEARIWLRRTDSDWHLSFRHAGWARLGLPDRQARVLRGRFTAAWVTALRDARELMGSA